MPSYGRDRSNPLLLRQEPSGWWLDVTNEERVLVVANHSARHMIDYGYAIDVTPSKETSVVGDWTND